MVLKNNFVKEKNLLVKNSLGILALSPILTMAAIILVKSKKKVNLVQPEPEVTQKPEKKGLKFWEMLKRFCFCQ